MFNRHKASLIECFQLLNRIKAAPEANYVTSKELQLLLLKRLIACETTIRKLTKERKGLKGSLGNKDKRLSKEEAARAKKRIAKIDTETEKYHKLIWIYREVGDGIAHSYIHSFDIKPLAFKETPGFISGKKGTRFERKVLRRHDANMPLAIIMNDLTNCLRYGDYTIAHPEQPINFIELKSGKRKKLNEREERQLARANKMASYLHTDVTDTLYGQEGEFSRQDMHADIVRNTAEINQLIEKSKKEGFASLKEKGFIYIVIHDVNVDHLTEVFTGVEDTHEYAFVNQHKFQNIGNYPFTLLIDDPENLFEFYNGEYTIMVCLNISQLTRDMEANGLQVDTMTQKELDDNGIDPSLYVFNVKDKHGIYSGYSIHFFTRFVVEFANYKWFKNELLHGAKKTLEIAIEKGIIKLPQTSED